MHALFDVSDTLLPIAYSLSTRRRASEERHREFLEATFQKFPEFAFQVETPVYPEVQVEQRSRVSLFEKGLFSESSLSPAV